MSSDTSFEMPTDDVDLETDKFLQLLQWSISQDEPGNDGAPDFRVKCLCRDVISSESSSGDYVDGVRACSPAREDSIDGILSGVSTPESIPDHLRPNLITSQTYDKKSAAEQDALHKHIARRLDEIAMEIDKNPRLQPVSAEDIASVPNYEAFASSISRAVGSDPGVQQLALFYQLSRDVVKATVSSDASAKLGNWIKTYYRDKIAPWVVHQQGLESCVIVKSAEVVETD